MKETEFEEVLYLYNHRREIIYEVSHLLKEKNYYSNTENPDWNTKFTLTHSTHYSDYEPRNLYSKTADTINGKFANTTISTAIALYLSEIYSVEQELKDKKAEFISFKIEKISEEYILDGVMSYIHNPLWEKT